MIFIINEHIPTRILKQICNLLAFPQLHISWPQLPIVIDVVDLGALNSVRNVLRLLVAMTIRQYIRYSFVHKCLPSRCLRL